MSEELNLALPDEELVSAASAALSEAGGDSSRAVMRLKSRAGASAGALNEAFEIALTRIRAGEQGLGAWVTGGLFTKTGLEQSSHPLISAHHASRFVGCDRVLEICTGLGFDTVALARTVKKVVSIEASPKLAEFARHNLKLQGVTNVEIITGRAEEILPTLDLNSFHGIWADPSRRTEAGTRVKFTSDYTPTLDFLFDLNFKGRLGIKIGPAHELSLPGEWQSEWLGLNDECLEHTLWRNVASPLVSLVDENISWSPKAPAEVLLRDPESDLARTFLIEPQAALIRCGSLDQFFSEIGAARFEPNIAYGSLDELPPESPFYTRFKILEQLPYNLKNLNRRLNELGWNNRTELKKRGFPETPEELRPKLKALTDNKSSANFGVIFFTQLGPTHTILLAERIRERNA